MELAAKKNLDPKIKSAAVEKIFSHPITAILLNLFHFDEAVKVHDNHLHISINKKESEIIIAGPKEYVDKIHHLLTTEDKKITKTSSDEDAEFFRDENVTEQVRAKSIKIDVNLHKIPAIFITDEANKGMLSINDYLSTTIVRVVCGKFIHESYEKNIDWREFVASFHSQYPTFKIFVKDRCVILYGLAENEYIHSILVSDIRNFGNHTVMWSLEFQGAYPFSDGSHEGSLSNRSKIPSDTENTFGDESGSLTYVLQVNGEEKTIVLHLPALKCKFCIRFLKLKFMAIEKSECAQIIIGKCSLTFKGAYPEKLHNTYMRVEQLLKELNCLEDHLEYPGLLAYVRSKRGRQVIDHFSNLNQCVIEFPDIEEEEKRFDYNSIIIGTAQIDNLKIHLVQGDYKDFNVGMKVAFCPIIGDKLCSLKVETSIHKIIALPPWKRQYQHPSVKKDNLALIRTSLQELLCLVLKKASQSNCTLLLFSTSEMHEAEFPFPIDCLAKSLINELLNTFLPLIEELGLRADVFICETKSEAVFKAFTFCLEKNKVPLKLPDQDIWDSISPLKIRNINKSFGASIELMESNSDFRGDDILFCYPIQPELKSVTCPAICEYSCAEKILQDDLRKLLAKKPDGLAIGETYRVNCFKNGKQALVYCFPKWGPGCDEAILAALKNCLLRSADYGAIHIIPPGLHVFPNYPLKYLVTTICQVLGQLLSKGILKKQRKIVLIVENKECRKELRKELEHYFPEAFENFPEWKYRMRNKIWAHQDFIEISDAHKDVLVSEISCQDVPVVICGHSKKITENILAVFNEKLHSSMCENFAKKELNKKETLLFQKIVHNATDLPVNFVLQKHHSNLETLPSKYLHITGKESSVYGSLELEVRKSAHTSNERGKPLSVMERGAPFSARERGKSPLKSRVRETSSICYREQVKSPSGARERVKSPCSRDKGTSPGLRKRVHSLHVPRQGERCPTHVRERGKSPNIPKERGKSPYTLRKRVTSPTGVRERGTFCSKSMEREKSLNNNLEIGSFTYSGMGVNRYSHSNLDRRVLTHDPIAKEKLIPASLEFKKILTGSTLTVYGLSDKLIKMFMSALSDACREYPYNLNRGDECFQPKVVDVKQFDEDCSENSTGEDN